MPYVNIKITKEGATSEQKAQLIQGATQLLGCIRKNPQVTEDGVQIRIDDNWLKHHPQMAEDRAALVGKH
jgi:4-oxalocrotonate tautomerase